MPGVRSDAFDIAGWRQAGCRSAWEFLIIPSALHIFLNGLIKWSEPVISKDFHHSTGVHFMVRSGFREYEVKKLRSHACSRQKNATFSPHIHGTWGPPFSPSLYNFHISEPFSFFTEAIVMLVAGRTTGNAKNFRPYFFSLNPDLVPLPACLMGSKNDIDSFHRHRSPLILGQGMRGTTFHVKACN